MKRVSIGSVRENIEGKIEFVYNWAYLLYRW